MPKLTNWTEARLQRLFDRYNCRYCCGKLSGWRVVIEQQDAPWAGLCVHRDRKIRIDVAGHPSDVRVRHTLLHEMAHAAAGPSRVAAHGYKFWGQVEHLLRKRAPFAVDWTEAYLQANAT